MHVVSMEKFASSIKQKYRERLINREEQWPPCHSDKLVKLELVEREKGEGYSATSQRGREDRRRGRLEGKAVKQTPLACGDLFKVESGKRPVRKVLVEGDAGIGKTTLCILVSEDWAKKDGKLFQQFELVLHLPLRMKAVASADSLPELLKLLHSSQKLCDSVVDYLEEEEGKHVLIIADGWNELSESKRQSGSFLYQLLFETFPLISVIVTSRPSAATSLHRLSCIDRFVEILGFSKDNVEEFIRCEFAGNKGKAISLLEQLENNPLIGSVCSVPLNCAIVCHLWRTLEEALPTTMTELYTKIILNVVLRNVQRARMQENILGLPNFDALPTDLQESWWLLCEFAYHALKTDQIVFSEEELADFTPKRLAFNKNVLCFGLLQSAESIMDIGRGLSFNFLHLTFQEYLAALHLAKELVDGQSSNSKVNQRTIEFKMFQSYDVQERFAIVWRFFFGIYFNVLACNDCAPIKPHLSYIRNNLVHCHCAFEARNADIESNIIYLFRQKFKIYSPHTAHDCAAILYVINKMQECPSVGIHFGNCHIGENQIRALSDSLASKNGKLQVVGLDLSGNELTYKDVDELLCRASSAFRSLKRLNLTGYKLEPENVMTMLAKPACQGLSRLNLSSSNLGVAGLQALENGVNAGWLTNIYKMNLSGSLTDDADVNAAALATFLKSLSDHCTHFNNLDLSDNNLGAPGASALAIAISQHNKHVYASAHNDLWLHSIYLNNTKLGDEGLHAFMEKLERPYCFSSLYLQNNDIHARGLTYLANTAPWFDYEAESDLDDDFDIRGDLDLTDNPIGIEGVIAVGKILSECNQYGVDLCRCNLTTAMESVSSPPSSDVIKHVEQKVYQTYDNYNVGYLALDGNCFTGERIRILAAFIYSCKSLVTLSCKDCDITSGDLTRLLEILSKSKISYNDLSTWNLDNNKIDDKGVFVLVHHMPSPFPNLSYNDVYLDGNPVSSEVVKKLKQKLYSLRQ